MSQTQSRFAFTELGRSLVAGAVSAATVIGVGTFGTLPQPAMVYAGLVGGLMFAGLSLALPRTLTLQEMLAASGEMTGLQAQEMERFLTTNQGYIDRLKAQREVIEDNQDVIDSIALWAERILENVKDDPSDIGRSGKFEVHLQEAALVVEKVADLRRKGQDVESEVIAEINAKARVVLDDIEDSFEKRYHRNLENNIRDVEVDLDVLKSALGREGL